MLVRYAAWLAFITPSGNEVLSAGHAGRITSRPKRAMELARYRYTSGREVGQGGRAERPSPAGLG